MSSTFFPSLVSYSALSPTGETFSRVRARARARSLSCFHWPAHIHTLSRLEGVSEMGECVLRREPREYTCACGGG